MQAEVDRSMRFVLRIAFAVFAIWLLMYAVSSLADTNLPATCGTLTVRGQSSCGASQRYAVPQAETPVSVVQATSTGWNWMPWGEVPDTALVSVCAVDIPIGTTSCSIIAKISKTQVASYPINVTGSFKLSWRPPLKNRDNSEYADNAGYWIYSAAAGSELSRLKRIEDPAQLTEMLSGYGPGTYRFAVTTINSKDEESTLSGAPSITVTMRPRGPGPVTDVSIVGVTLE